MYQNSTVNMADITDGTSTTILIGESIWPQGVWSQATSCRRSDQHRPNDQQADRHRTAPVFWTYWASKHPSPVNFAYCDGSVRPVTSQINKIVLNKL